MGCISFLLTEKVSLKKLKALAKNGFTIIELMITIGLLAVMVTLGIPAFTSTINSNETAAKSNAFLSALKMARSEATKRRLTIFVCASDNQTDCASNDWSDGWIVFEDTDSSNAFEAANDTIIDTYQLPNGFAITRGGPNPDEVRFLATGLSNATPAQAFTICKANTSTGRQLTMDRSGLVTGADVNCP
jgi:prepilin-type N-terminal cleavage/methylation domain